MDPITPTTPIAPTEQPINTPQNKKVGPIVTVLVIVLILIIGALYLFASRVNNAPETQDTTSTETAEVTPVTNESDDISSIEADLDGSIDGVDSQNF